MRPNCHCLVCFLDLFHLPTDPNAFPLKVQIRTLALHWDYLEEAGCSHKFPQNINFASSPCTFNVALTVRSSNAQFILWFSISDPTKRSFYDEGGNFVFGCTIFVNHLCPCKHSKNICNTTI